MSQKSLKNCKSCLKSPISVTLFTIPKLIVLWRDLTKRLKTLLYKVMDKDWRNWDFLLPYLMFYMQEVPQAFTGYSPFELLYIDIPGDY